MNAFVAAHAAFIGWLLGIWCFLVAPLINQKLWPKPKAGSFWLWTFLHFVLIDWPAAKVSAGATASGIVLHFFGYEIPIPFVSWSTLLEGPPRAPASAQRGFTKPEILLLLAGAGALLVLVFYAAGCSGGVAGAWQSLANTSTSGDAALKAFEAFDHDYQQKIVGDDKRLGKTEEQIEADLSAYRQKRATVNKAFADFGAAVTAGHALLPLVSSGIKKQTDMNTWLGQLFAAGTELQTAISEVQK